MNLVAYLAVEVIEAFLAWSSLSRRLLKLRPLMCVLMLKIGSVANNLGAYDG